MDTKDEEPDKQAWARETSHAGNTRFFTNGAAARARPLPRLSVLVQNPRGPGPMEQFKEQPSFPRVGEGPWSSSFTLYSRDIWSWNEGPQLPWFFTSYPVLSSQDSPTKGAPDTHTLQPACPTVLVVTPTELLSGVTEGPGKPETAAVASAEVIKAKTVLPGLLIGLSHNKMHLKWTRLNCVHKNSNKRYKNQPLNQQPQQQ